MCVFLFILFFIYAFAADAQWHGPGRAFCRFAFWFMLLPTLVFLLAMLGNGPQSDGSGWIFLVSLVLTIGFWVAGFGEE